MDTPASHCENRLTLLSSMDDNVVQKIELTGWKVKRRSVTVNHGDVMMEWGQRELAVAKWRKEIFLAWRKEVLPMLQKIWKRKTFPIYCLIYDTCLMLVASCLFCLFILFYFLFLLKYISEALLT